MAAAIVPESSMPSVFNPEAPEFRPSMESTKMRAEAAEFIPMAGAWAMCEVLQQQQQKRQMPPATDEEWEARTAKREKEVETIKSLQSYRLYVEVFPHDKRGDDDPKTPDPRDRNVSKRMWKWNVEKWRLQLKSRCVYSRAVALQCREYVLMAEAAEQEAEDPGMDGEEASTEDEQGRARRRPRAQPWGDLGLLCTVDIPQPPGIPMLPGEERRKERRKRLEKTSSSSRGSNATSVASPQPAAQLSPRATSPPAVAAQFQ